MAVLFLLLALAGSFPIAGQTTPVNHYVDARICAGCHAEIARTYARTGMGRSFYRPTPTKMVEDFTRNNRFDHALSETRYAMTSREGAYYQRRWQIGLDGQETNAEESKIDYVLGSGNHARSYLHRTPRGTLIELPLGWYAEKGGSWGMSPGFDSPHPATRRLISYECMFCHNGYPRIPLGHDSPGSEPVFTDELPEGIDCQRCHGPGGDHVRAAQSGAGEKARSAIVNPARLSSKLQMDLCMQCHLEPASSAIPALVRRFDRGPFSFKPGEPLSAFVLAFDHARGAADDKFEIVGSSAYRLRQSRCFLRSNDALTCQTCHDPHGGRRNYSETCRGCHSGPSDAQHTASADCVSCHMPKRRTEDVVHVVMTDHLIQRRPPARDLLAELPERHPAESEEYRGEVVPYYPAALPRADAIYRAFAQVAMKNNLRAGVVELARLLAQQPLREPQWYIQLGEAWLAQGDTAKAAGAYEQAVRLRPQSARALVALAAAWKPAGQPSRALEAAQKATQADPADARAWYQFGALALDMGRPILGIERMQKAIELDPDLPGAYTTLAGLQNAAGQSQQAQESLREALRIDPYDAAAWDLSGQARAERGEFPAAFFCFEKAIRYRPGYAPYLYDYGLTLASAQQFDRAEENAAVALRADPKLGEAHALMGNLLARKQQLREAAGEYREALRLRPDLVRVRLDLASVLVTQGDRAGAARELREAAKSNDPNVARIAAGALQRLGER